jgi:FKBP-type peptidyl-prolyl cis-trans isomerase 2
MKGQVVGVHYVGTFDDGTEFDNSRTRGNPLFFRVGERQVINGFETAVMGMSVGETKNFVVTPEQAYGHNDPNLLREVPRNNFPTDFAFKEGMMVEMKSPQGKPFPAQVTSFTQDAVTLDFNHPLSGKTLNFEIELVKTEDSEETTTTKGET